MSCASHDHAAVAMSTKRDFQVVKFDDSAENRRLGFGPEEYKIRVDTDGCALRSMFSPHPTTTNIGKESIKRYGIVTRETVEVTTKNKKKEKVSVKRVFTIELGSGCSFGPGTLTFTHPHLDSFNQA